MSDLNEPVNLRELSEFRILISKIKDNATQLARVADEIDSAHDFSVLKPNDGSHINSKFLKLANIFSILEKEIHEFILHKSVREITNSLVDIKHLSWGARYREGLMYKIKEALGHSYFLSTLPEIKQILMDNITAIKSIYTKTGEEVINEICGHLEVAKEIESGMRPELTLSAAEALLNEMTEHKEGLFRTLLINTRGE